MFLAYLVYLSQSTKAIVQSIKRKLHKEKNQTNHLILIKQKRKAFEITLLRSALREN